MSAPPSPLVIRPATAEDAAAVAVIYNQGIADRVATFETEPRPAEERRRWIVERDPRFAVLVAERDGPLAGFASISPYSSRPCYRGVAEHSIYIGRDARGRGVGRALLTALVEAAAREGFWKLTSRIFPFNEASRALHRAVGFREVGINEKHARLDGRWLDTVTVECLIAANLTDE